MPVPRSAKPSRYPQHFFEPPRRPDIRMAEFLQLMPGDLNLVGTVFIKLLVGAILAGAVGWEREAHGRPAGIRTHMLVVFGVILFGEVSRAFAGGDPSRVAAQVVVGIGFLGAGAILRTGGEVHGLTTAASVWAISAVGLTVSLGGAYIFIALLTTIMILITLGVIDNLEYKLLAKGVRGEIVLGLESREVLGKVIDEVQRRAYRLQSMRVIAYEPELEVAFRVSGSHERLMSLLGTFPGVTHLNMGS